MVEKLVFSGLLWRATGVLAWPHLWLQRRRMRVICGDDCSTEPLVAANDKAPPDANVGGDRFHGPEKAPRMVEPKHGRPSMQVATNARPIRVNVYYSPEAQGYWASSPDLDGLTVAGDTRDEVMQEARWAAETLLDLAGVRGVPELTFNDAEYTPE